MAKIKFYKSELTVSCESNGKNKNYLGLFLSVIVLVLISSLIVAAIVIINPEIVTFSSKPYTPREAITLEESLLGELSANNFAFQWLSSQSSSSSLSSSNDKHYDELLFEDSKNLNIITMPPGEQQLNQSLRNVHINIPSHRFEPNLTTLIPNISLLSSIEYQGFRLSPSKRYLLIWTTKRKLFRYTFTAKYFLYDIKLDLISVLSTRQVATGDLLSPQNSFEQLYSVSENLNNKDDEYDEHTRFQMVDWLTGEGEWGRNVDDRDSLILIQNNDIYLLANVTNNNENNQNTANNKSQQSTPSRITFTGKVNEIYNGVPDWLYEEEILGDTPAFQVSPNANTLAYMSFNDSQVDFMPFSIYGTNEQVIPVTTRIRYPKAGRVNPRVSVHVVDNEHSHQYKDTELQLPGDLSQRQHYINRIRWLTNDKLVLIWLNRNQNESYFVVCSRNMNWLCEKNLHLTAEGGWLDLTDDLYPLDENYYLALLFKNEGPDVGDFKHIAKISLKQKDTFTFLTNGRKEVTNINGINKKESIIYYTSSLINEPGQRQMFSVYFNLPENFEPEFNCITCDHYPGECLYNFAKMSPSTNYYIFECEGPGVPRTELRSTRRKMDIGQRQTLPLQPAPILLANVQEVRSSSLSDLNSPPSLTSRLNYSRKLDENKVTQKPDDSLLWTIEDNQELRDKLTYSKAMPLTMRLKVPIPNTNYSANVIMLLPPQLGSTTIFRAPQAAFAGPSRRARPRRSAIPINSNGIEQAIHSYFTPDSIEEYTRQLTGGQQYPMVVDVYAGPGSQKVNYRFDINFGHYLASSRRTIYVMIDGRGSGGQGTKRMYELYHKFGTVEIQDQIEVAGYLTRNFSFIDPSKVAIWGWSYGGYAAAMALAQSNAQSLQTLHAHIKVLNISNSTVTRDNSNGDGINNNNRYKPNTYLPATLNGVFECAVSVAPVTNWIYYDTTYTERYMSSPYMNELYDKTNSGDHNAGLVENSNQSMAGQNHHEPANKWLPLNQTINSYLRLPALLNPIQISSSLTGGMNTLNLNDRYKTASLLNHIVNIDRKRFLLIHGTADDNVHFQQSIMLMKRLIHKNVMFESRLYPDQDHGIANKADKLHLGSTLSNFFAECFDMAY